MVTKGSLFGNKQPGDMTNGANSNFRRVQELGRSWAVTGSPAQGAAMVARGSGGGGETGHCVPESGSVSRSSCAHQKCVDPGISGSVLYLNQALGIFSLYHPIHPW